MRWLPITIAGAVLAGVVAFITTSGDGNFVQSEMAIVARLRQEGKLDQAAAAIGRLRREWESGAATDDRLERLAAEEAELAAIAADIQRLTVAVLDPAVERDYGDWNFELRRLESEGTSSERVAARRVRSSLSETLRQRPKAVVPKAIVQPADDAVASAATSAKASPSSSAPKPAEAAPPANQPHTPPSAPATQIHTASIVEAERLAQQGLFAQAIAVLQGALAEAPDQDTTALLQREVGHVRTQAQRALTSLLADAERSLAATQAEAAVALLVAARHRFPPTAEFQLLAQTIGKAEAAVAAATPKAVAIVRPPVVDEAVRTATLQQLRTQMEGVRAAEERGAFADAGRLLREAAGLARDRDADFAARLEGRAAEADLMAAWHQSIAAVLQTGRTLKCTSSAGRAITLQAINGAELVGTSADGTVHISWLDVSPFGLAMLAEQTQVRGEAALGAATLLYKNADADRAEALLANALQAEAELKVAIDGVLARGRGEPVDGRGYTLGKDGFVSARSVELQKEALKLTAKLEAAMGDRNPAARDKLLTDVMASGPEAITVLVAALRKQFEQKLAKIDSSTLKKQVDRLAEQRTQLDSVRDAARSLIYDEVKYFYPYQPPAVSSEQFAEYNRVQAEVDRRVAALRAVWKDERTKVRVPASLRTDLERIDWIARVLGDLGELDAKALARIDWARALPVGDSVGIRDFCVSSAERVELEEWRQIEAYNTIVGKQMASAVREQLAITNEYRAMFRHRPLALVKAICQAAQGHADEMTKLGYFAHMSPVPGRRTPFDRMRLAGYMSGVSENIALHDGALGAHNAWCTSSGHHRNLLDPSHREMGIGAAGRNWVQNFGASTVHRSDPAWAAAAEASR